MKELRTKQWNIGNVEITRIHEMTDPIPWSFLFPEESADHYKRYDWLTPYYFDDEGRLLLAVQAFVVGSGSRRIIVDTCVGNDKLRSIPSCNNLQTSFLQKLTAAGYPPDTIDTVLCTHLHFDHVGWNTRLVDGRWLPAFPNARYLFGRREWEYWQRALREQTVETNHILDSVQPILDAGLAEFVEPEHRITEEIGLEPTPGHTPGHVSVHIASRGQHGVITGDIFHTPLQIAEPELCVHACVDHEMSCRTRREFVSRYEDKEEVLVFGTHFEDPTVGRIVRDAHRHRFATAR